MRTIITIALAAAANAATEMEAAFMSYISDFSKNYSSMNEFNLRFEQFVRNYSHIITHNAEDHQFSLGLNQFSDWTQEEYKSMLGSFAA